MNAHGLRIVWSDFSLSIEGQGEARARGDGGSVSV